MSDDSIDIAVARYVRTAGLATAEQVTAAMQEQSRSAASGTALSLSEALLKLGFLTAAQRSMVEQKAQGKGGIQQLLHYRLIRKLGEGGMGAVYLAEDLQEKRQVAVKVLPRQHSSNRDLVKRFQREAAAAIRLKHPNIVQAFASGEDLGYHFYAMEYCEGQPLDALLKKSGPLAVDRSVRIILDAARGLRCAHEQGIIHRDIKPANLILAGGDLTKILDLGLSKDLGEGEKSFRTQTGAIMGTPHYISPEQAQGEKSIDGRTDIYSLGGTFYHLLTGQTPFEGASALEIMSKHVTGHLTNPQELRPEIPDAAVAVISRMMAKDPADRYATCAELVVDLEELASGGAPRTLVLDAKKTTIAPLQRAGAAPRRPPTVRRTTPPPAPASRMPLIAGLAAAVVVAGSLAFFLSGKPSSASPAAPKLSPVSAPAPAKSPAVTPAPAALPPDDLARKVVARLRELNPKWQGEERWETQSGVVFKFMASGVGLADLSPLREWTSLRELTLQGAWDGARAVDVISPLSDLRPLKGLPLVVLNLHRTSVRDLSPLVGAPIQDLNLSATPLPPDLQMLQKFPLRSLNLSLTLLSDLRPLKGMSLGTLDIAATKVTDLSPLAGMPLKGLAASFAPLSDLGPLRGMALESLGISNCKVTDFSPLRGMPLRELNADLDPVRDLELVRSMASLTTVNGKPADVFLKRTPAVSLPPLPAVQTMTALPGPDAWKKAPNLLLHVDPSLDTVDGEWEIRNGDLVSGDGMNVRVQLPYQPPEEYDFRVEFTPTGALPDVNLLLTTQGHNFNWFMGAYGGTILGFGFLPSIFPDKDPRNVVRARCLEPGRRYVTIVQVRRTGVAGWLDGVKILELGPEYREFGGAKSKLGDESRIGLASYKCPALFHQAQVLDVTGKGVLMRPAKR